MASHANAYELVRDIDFSASFSDATELSDVFDPADLDGIFDRAKAETDGVAGEKGDDALSRLPVFKMPLLSSPLKFETKSQPKIRSPQKYVNGVHQFEISNHELYKQVNSPEKLPLKKRLKQEVAQCRAYSTSNKLKDAYPTIQLATQREFSVPDTIESTKEIKNVKPIVLSSEQEYVLNLAMLGRLIFFTGSAGTGKSVLLRLIIKNLKTKYKNKPAAVAVTASTGLAACNIGGITLHSFAGIGLGQALVPELVTKIKRNKKALRKWAHTEVLIIDEISMIDGKLFDKLDEIAQRFKYLSKPFGGIQIIACGDFYQLPPVSKSETLPDGTEIQNEAMFAFESDSWARNIQLSIILKEVFRQKGDQQFIDMLNDMRTGVVTDATEAEFHALSRPLECPKGLVPTQLYATRYEVENANKVKLGSLPGESKCYNSIDSGTLPPHIRQTMLNNFLAPQKLFLKKSAQVMCIKNFDDTLVNGSLGQVVDFLDKDTYMCQNYLAEHPDASADDLHKILSKDKENAGRFDSVFEFLHQCEHDHADSEDTAFWNNSQRKRQLFENIASSTGGDKYPLVRFLLPDGVNTRDVLVEPESWAIEDDKTKEVLANRVQLPLMLAWALSIHKSQGQTLPLAKVDLSRIFERGQAYVALSRAVSRDALQVLNFRKEKVTTHWKVQEFYRSLMTTEELARIPDIEHVALYQEALGLLQAQAE